MGLLDEQVSPAVAAPVRANHPEVNVVSVPTWRDADLRGEPDGTVLRLAGEAGLTLVTYDVSTISPLLVEWAASGENHAGVIFLDHRTVAQQNLGGQVTALLAAWTAGCDWNWTNRVLFLQPAVRSSRSANAARPPALPCLQQVEEPAADPVRGGIGGCTG